MRQLTPTQNKLLAWEIVRQSAPAMLGRFRGLGDVCVVTQGGSRVCSADATATSGSLAQTNPRAVTRANRMVNTGIPLQVSTSGPLRMQVPTVANTLATAQSVYNSNPAALTQNQWALLQSAGVIPSTMPFTSASSLPASQSTAAAAATTTTASTDIMLGGFDLTQFVESVPWWGWALGAGGAFYLMTRGGKGRR